MMVTTGCPVDAESDEEPVGYGPTRTSSWTPLLCGVGSSASQSII
jgi:hypothetical protein